MMHALTTRSVYFLNNVHVRSTESIYSICIPKLSHIWILHTSIHSKCTSIYRKRSSFSDTHQSPQYRVWMHIIQTIQSLKWPKLQGVKNYADRNSWTTEEKKTTTRCYPTRFRYSIFICKQFVWSCTWLTYETRFSSNLPRAYVDVSPPISISTISAERSTNYRYTLLQL